MIPQRPLGRTGLLVSMLGYGGAPIGFTDDRGADFVALLQRACDLGVTFFDTAPDYRRSEELIGQALAGRRERVVLATKCGRVQEWTGGAWDTQEDWSEAGVLRQIEQSLRRLKTDYLDLVQLHSPPLYALDDGAALRALQRAQQAGKVGFIGVSADGDTAGRALDLDIFATLQISYSILEQEPGRTLLPRAAAQGLGLIIKQPVANGIPNLRACPDPADWRPKWDVAQRMDWPALGADGDRLPLALAWVLTNPLVSVAIAGTTDPAHLEANVAVAGAPPLDAAQWVRIQAAYDAARGAAP